jgi:hypothetical protein
MKKVKSLTIPFSYQLPASLSLVINFESARVCFQAHTPAPLRGRGTGESAIDGSASNINILTIKTIRYIQCSAPSPLYVYCTVSLKTIGHGETLYGRLIAATIFRGTKNQGKKARVYLNHEKAVSHKGPTAKNMNTIPIRLIPKWYGFLKVLCI